jgi:hypothetical protein
MSMHYCQQGAVKPNVYVVTCKKCPPASQPALRSSPEAIWWSHARYVVSCAATGPQRCIWASLTAISNSNRCPSRGDAGGR